MGGLGARSVLVVLCAVALGAAGIHPAAGATGSETSPTLPGGVQPRPAIPGAELWAKVYDGPSSRDDGATSLGVSPDGSTVFVAGGSTGTASSYDYTILAYRASTGTKEWAKRYDGPAHGYDQATAVGVRPNGSTVFVTGASRGSGTNEDYATVAYQASTGARVWAKRYDGPGHGIDYAHALTVSPDGSIVFVTGESKGSHARSDFATVAYRASTGRRLWVERYDGPGHGDDKARGLGVSPDGSKVFVTGESVGSTGDPDYATVAYRAATGRRLWVKRYDGPGNYVDNAHALTVNPTGRRVFVTGESIGSDGGWDYATVAYRAATGAKVWVKRYNGTGKRDDYATDLTVGPDGSTVFVTGLSSGTSTYDYRFDYATVAYRASTGARLWVTRYDGPANGNDEASALGASPDGAAVLVTGVSLGPTGFLDYATVAYDTSSGAPLWTERYDGPAQSHDYAYALTVSPDGSAVFVTGETTASTGFVDYGTVAYSVS